MADVLAGAAPAAAIRSAVPTFLVPDVGATARWYADELGFTVGGMQPDHAPHVYASVHRGGAEIMLLSMEGYRKPELGRARTGGAWDAYLRTDGVRALYETVAGKPFVQAPLALQRYGDWEFDVRDPNGYVLVFGGSE
jgi:catechol 2,3-dioxygenase-like lactoylglutathione lyase family enzyme